jgi:hypothetical protein
MIVSDLNYLESVENNVEGAGYADFYEEFELDVDAQRIAFADVRQYIDVYADARKTISFDKYVFAFAEV